MVQMYLSRPDSWLEWAIDQHAGWERLRHQLERQCALRISRGGHANKEPRVALTFW